MTPELEKQLAEASGEANYKFARLLELNEVTLNGDGEAVEGEDGKWSRKGGYFRKRILVGHRDRNVKPEEENLGPKIRVVLLRKRRRLIERGQEGKIVRSTNEHNAPSDVVTLYTTDTKESVTGVAKELRAKYENLRTTEIFYALLLSTNKEAELVRLIIKGSSLGSEAKAATTTDLYDYLQSFSSKEHAWQYETNLSAVIEQGKKTYYAIDFKRGDRLEDTMIAGPVATNLFMVKENITEFDAARREKIAEAPVDQKSKNGPQETEDALGRAFDENDNLEDNKKVDDINPDDIPF